MPSVRLRHISRQALFGMRRDRFPLGASYPIAGVDCIRPQQQSSLLQRVVNSLSSKAQCSSRHDESSAAVALEVAAKSAALPARFVYYWDQSTNSQGRWGGAKTRRIRRYGQAMTALLDSELTFYMYANNMIRRGMRRTSKQKRTMPGCFAKICRGMPMFIRTQIVPT